MSTKTKTPVKPLRAQILDFLASRAEASLKQIAEATSERDFPSRVTTELNKMRTDALVECGKKTGKNELWYWLASPSSAVPDSQPAVEQNTGSSAASASKTRPAGAAVQPEPAPVAAAATPSAAPAAADVQPQSAEFPPQITPEIPPTEAEDDAMPPADASLLALANRELADRLARVAHVLRGSGLEGLKGLDDGADLQTATAALTGAYQVALANLQARGEQFLEMQDELNRRDDELLAQASTIADLRSQLAVANALADMSTDRRADLSVLSRASETLEALLPPTEDIEGLDVDALAERVAERVRELETELRNQLEGLQREAMRGATCLSGQDRYTAAGYLVRASKRKPRTLLDKDKARDAALSSIRAGAQRAEVFALVSIGHARRGAEWRSA